MKRRAALVLGLLVGPTLLYGVPPAGAASVVSPTSDAQALATAIEGEPGTITGASFVTRPPQGQPTAVITGPLGGMPTHGGTAALLTTGDARLADQPNSSGNSGADNGGMQVRGNTDYDVVILKIEINVPATSNCLAGLDFRFFSEEYPEYVGSSFNDAFIAELNQSTWTTSGSTINAPRNFAFDPSGNPITINAAGTTSMAVEPAAGTTYDGATPLLTAATPVDPGPNSLYLSIFDQGDRIYDSAVIVDNLRFSKVADVTTDCKPGAKPIAPRNYVALGDSYSSGFGVSPYEAGTDNKNSEGNNCQRSTTAYSKHLADALELPRSFHACQGGVTADFYNKREDRHPSSWAKWGELRQLDHLDEEAALVTLTVGGNDAHFSDVFAECFLGMELLPFNTCYQDKKVTEPVREALERLDGTRASPTSITPYRKLFTDIRKEASHAQVVTMGYPRFFPPDGGDRTFLPGGRCEGIKKADQRWMMEQVDKLNGIIARHARRRGFMYADPNGLFAGHELCGKDGEWFFPVLHPGRIHPTGAGHVAMGQAVNDELERTKTTFSINQDETKSYALVVEDGKVLLTVAMSWPGSDIVTTLTSPSGRVFTRWTQASDVWHTNGPTYELYEIEDPEPGEWTVVHHGADVSLPDGEPVTVSLEQEDPANVEPTAAFTWSLSDRTLQLDSSSSTDVDGHVVEWDWYVASADTDVEATGERATVTLSDAGPWSVTLVAIDDRGGVAFSSQTVVRVDVRQDAIRPSSSGLTPVVVFSSRDFDATTLDASALRFGPGKAEPAQPAKSEDVDGDGLHDLLVHFRTADSHAGDSGGRMCVTGELPDGIVFAGCDTVRIVPPSKTS